MFFLEISDSCITVLGVIYFIRELLKIVFILVPIGLIVMLMIDFYRGIISFNDDSKKILGLIIRRLIYTMVIFLIPGLLYGVFGVIGIVNKDSESCWTYVGEHSIEEVQEKIAAQKAKIEAEEAKKLEELKERLKDGDANKRKLILTIVSNSSSGSENFEESGEYKGIDLNDLTKTSGMTASDLTSKLNSFKENASARRFIPYASDLIKTENKYKVNVIFLMSLEAHESAWLTSSASKECNNLGGVKGTPKCPGHKYRKFSDKAEFINYHGELLGNKYLSKSGSYYHGTAVEDVKKDYCPESSCSTWVQSIKAIVKTFTNKFE